MRILQHARRDRPESRLPLWRLWVEHDASDVPITGEQVIIIIRPLAARSVFKQTQ
jgi:hypothetical protein